MGHYYRTQIISRTFYLVCNQRRINNGRGCTMSIKKHFTTQEAREIGEELGIDWKKFDVEQFRMGLDVELEHGLIDPQTNITDDDPILTGKIALAHLNELSDYYTRLYEMEEEAERVVSKRGDYLLYTFRLLSGSLSVIHNSFMVAQAAETAKHFQQFVVSKQKIRITGFTELQLVYGVSLIHHHSAFLQSVPYLPDQRAVQVVEADNNIIGIFVD